MLNFRLLASPMYHICFTPIIYFCIFWSILWKHFNLSYNYLLFSSFSKSIHVHTWSCAHTPHRINCQDFFCLLRVFPFYRIMHLFCGLWIFLNLFQDSNHVCVCVFSLNYLVFQDHFSVLGIWDLSFIMLTFLKHLMTLSCLLTFKDGVLSSWVEFID